MHCLDIVWLVSPSNHLRAASCFFNPQPSSVSTPEGLGRLETLLKCNKLGSNLLPFRISGTPVQCSILFLSISLSELLTIFMLTCFVLFHHVPMIALWKRSELKRLTQQIWHMKLLAISVRSWIILLFHYITIIKCTSLSHLNQEGTWARTYKAPALLGSTARQKSKNTWDWDTSEVAVATTTCSNMYQP